MKSLNLFYISVISIGCALFVPYTSCEVVSIIPISGISMSDFSNDGRFIACVYNEGGLATIDVQSGIIQSNVTCIGELTNFLTVDFETDHNLCAVGGDDRIIVFKEEPSSIVQSIQITYPDDLTSGEVPWFPRVKAVTLSSDGKYIAAARGVYVFLIDRTTGTIVWSQKVDDVWGISFIQNDSTIYTWSPFGITLIGRNTGEVMNSFGNTGEIEFSLLSADKHNLLIYYRSGYYEFVNALNFESIRIIQKIKGEEVIGRTPNERYFILVKRKIDYLPEIEKVLFVSDYPYTERAIAFEWKFDELQPAINHPIVSQDSNRIFISVRKCAYLFDLSAMQSAVTDEY